MGYLIMLVVGLIGGGTCVFAGLDAKRRLLVAQKQRQDAEAEQMQEALAQTRVSEQQFVEHCAQVRAELKQKEQDALQAIEQRRQHLHEELAQLKTGQQELKTAQQEFDARVIAYNELQGENSLLRQDLRNLAVNARKLELDRELQRQSQETIDQRVRELGSRYLKENVKWIGQSINPNNYAASKQRLVDVIERCRGIGFQISESEEGGYLSDLRAEYEKVVRAAFEREEQARIRAQIREEQKREREIQREQERIDRERAALQAALEKALEQFPFLRGLVTAVGEGVVEVVWGEA